MEPICDETNILSNALPFYFYFLLGCTKRHTLPSSHQKFQKNQTMKVARTRLKPKQPLFERIITMTGLYIWNKGDCVIHIRGVLQK